MKATHDLKQTIRGKAQQDGPTTRQDKTKTFIDDGLCFGYPAGPGKLSRSDFRRRVLGNVKTSFLRQRKGHTKRLRDEHNNLKNGFDKSMRTSRT